MGCCIAELADLFWVAATGTEKLLADNGTETLVGLCKTVGSHVQSRTERKSRPEQWGNQETRRERKPPKMNDSLSDGAREEERHRDINVWQVSGHQSEIERERERDQREQPKQNRER